MPHSLIMIQQFTVQKAQRKLQFALIFGNITFLTGTAIHLHQQLILHPISRTLTLTPSGEDKLFHKKLTFFHNVKAGFVRSKAISVDQAGNSFYPFLIPKFTRNFHQFVCHLVTAYRRTDRQKKKKRSGKRNILQSVMKKV